MALREFVATYILSPDIPLTPQHPHVGYSGLPGFGLGEEDLRKVQRFWPTQFVDNLYKNIHLGTLKTRTPLLDTIAFFIVKFVKIR